MNPEENSPSRNGSRENDDSISIPEDDPIVGKDSFIDKEENTLGDNMEDTGRSDIEINSDENSD